MVLRSDKPTSYSTSSGISKTPYRDPTCQQTEQRETIFVIDLYPKIQHLPIMGRVVVSLKRLEFCQYAHAAALQKSHFTDTQAYGTRLPNSLACILLAVCDTACSSELVHFSNLIGRPERHEGCRSRKNPNPYYPIQQYSLPVDLTDQVCTDIN